MPGDQPASKHGRCATNTERSAVKISCGCELSELAAVFVLFCRKRRGCAHAARAALLRSSFNSRMPECQSGDAGATPVDRTIFNTRRGGRQLAQQSLQNSASPGQHRDAAPSFPSINCGVAKWEGTGLISRQRVGSIPASATIFLWAARSFRRSPALQAGERGAKPRRSTIFQIAGRLRTCGVS